MTTDITTTMTGTWAPQYAERLHHIQAVSRDGWSRPTPDDVTAMAAWGAPFGEPEASGAVTEDREIPGPTGPIPVRIYCPASGDPTGPGLVWYHGGGFMHGDLDMPEADHVAHGLVTRTGCVVVSVFYRLCLDGVTHPAPHEDCWAAFGWTREHAPELGIDPGRVAVGGASAGANLAASVALRSARDGRPAWQALLAYPVVHPVLPEATGELAERLATMPPVLRFEPDTVRWMNENYLGGPVDTADACAFPALADDLSGFPPTYIENCEFDDLRSSGEAFGRQLADAGVDVEIVTAAGVPHGHLNAVGSPNTFASLDRFAARLQR